MANQNSSSQALHCQKDEREPLSKLFAAQFSRSVGSFITARLRREEIQKEFDLSLWIRTFDQDGLIMASIVSQRSRETKSFHQLRWLKRKQEQRDD